MPSRQELLNSIQPNMKLTKSFFMRIYGYEITWPGFAEQSLIELERVGCSKAREYYQRFISEYKQEHDEMMKSVAEWYRKQCDGDYKKKKKGSDVSRKLQEMEQLKEDLHQKSDRELLTLLQKIQS